MDSVADQLIGLFVSRFYSMFTSPSTRLFVARASSSAMPVTPRPSDSSCSRTKWAHFTARTSLATLELRSHQLRQGLLGARTSPPMPETPRRSDITTYVEDSSVLGHRQRRGDFSALGHRLQRRGLLAPRFLDIASEAGDSSLFGAWTSPATPRTPRSSVLGHRQRCRGLLGTRTSPATPGTPHSSVVGHRQRR